MSVTCPHCGAPRTGSSCPYCGVLIEGGARAPAAPAALPAGVLEALQAGNKIDAIRLYHVAKKCSLRDAKSAVDALEATLAKR